ncbi:MAG: GNAT family protein, partial [Candidatus Zixiibacteriota bacterium]
LDTPSRQVLQLHTELPTSEESIKNFLEKYSDCKDVDGIIIFVIENEEGKNVGGISFHSRKRMHGTFSIGLDIDRPYWRRGYGEEAIRILLRYAFNERNYQKFNSAVVVRDVASIGLHKKIGCVEEGRRRRMWYFDGQYHDEILFGLTREEFHENDS